MRDDGGCDGGGEGCARLAGDAVFAGNGKVDTGRGKVNGGACACATVKPFCGIDGCDGDDVGVCCGVSDGGVGLVACGSHKDHVAPGSGDDDLFKGLVVGTGARWRQ